MGRWTHFNKQAPRLKMQRGDRLSIRGRGSLPSTGCADENDDVASIHCLDGGILHHIFCIVAATAVAPSSHAAGSRAASACPMMLVCRGWRLIANDPRILAAALISLDGPAHALVRAAKHGREDTVVLILNSAPPPADCEAPVKVEGDGRVLVAHADCLDGRALVVAASGGHAAVVRLLLGSKKHPARADCQDGEALVRAAQAGHAAVVRELLECAEHASWACCQNGNALIEAAGAGHVAIVQLLLGIKQHPARADCQNGEALLRAVDAGHTAVVRMLLDCEELAARASGRTLIRAADAGHAGVVQLLLDCKGLVGFGGAENGAALLCACRGGHAAVVRVLLDHPRGASGKSGCEERALSMAVGLKQEALVRMLLPRVERRGHRSFLPVHPFIIWGFKPRKFLALGACFLSLGALTSHLGRWNLALGGLRAAYMMLFALVGMGTVYGPLVGGGMLVFSFPLPILLMWFGGSAGSSGWLVWLGLCFFRMALSLCLLLSLKVYWQSAFWQVHLGNRRGIVFASLMLASLLMATWWANETEGLPKATLLAFTTFFSTISASLSTGPTWY